MKKSLLVMLLAAATMLLIGCGAPKQKIPVSTNPIGATIYADGDKMCVSPCSVRLEKTSEHLITIVKDGYEQVDLTISRQFRPDKALRDAAISAVITGSSDPKVIAGEAAKEVDEQERSGEAYVLVPEIIAVTLQPETSK